MTSENYGTILPMDPIAPLNYNNQTIGEVIPRVHFANTQPLYASENLTLGNEFVS